MADIIVPAEQEGTTAVVKSWLKNVGFHGQVGDDRGRFFGKGGGA